MRLPLLAPTAEPETDTPAVRSIGRRGLLAAAGVGTAALVLPVSAEEALAAPGGWNGPITRAEIISRARSWTAGTEAASVPYSRGRTIAKPDGNVQWRTDCSGFTSMCLKIRTSANPTGLSTGQLHPSAGFGVLRRIDKAAMRPGDVFLATAAELGKPYGHAAIFEAWGPTKGTARIIELTDRPWQGYRGPGYCIRHVVPWPLGPAFTAYRCVNVRD